LWLKTRRGFSSVGDYIGVVELFDKLFVLPTLEVFHTTKSMRTPRQAKAATVRKTGKTPAKADSKRSGGSVIDLRWHPVFIRALGGTANVSGACRACGVCRDTAYDHRERFPDFKRQWDEAEAFALDTLYTTGLQHATFGTEKPVYHGGVQVGTITEYDHKLLQWFLERKRPEEFGGKQKLELSGNLAMTPEEISEASREAERSLLLTLAGGLNKEKR
jgi:hypothetical protein